MNCYFIVRKLFFFELNKPCDVWGGKTSTWPQSTKNEKTRRHKTRARKKVRLHLCSFLYRRFHKLNRKEAKKAAYGKLSVKLFNKFYAHFFSDFLIQIKVRIVHSRAKKYFHNTENFFFVIQNSSKMLQNTGK